MSVEFGKLLPYGLAVVSKASYVCLFPLKCTICNKAESVTDLEAVIAFVFALKHTEYGSWQLSCLTLVKEQIQNPFALR